MGQWMAKRRGAQRERERERENIYVVRCSDVEQGHLQTCIRTRNISIRTYTCTRTHLCIACTHIRAGALRTA